MTVFRNIKNNFLFLKKKLTKRIDIDRSTCFLIFKHIVRTLKPLIFAKVDKAISFSITREKKYRRKKKFTEILHSKFVDAVEKEREKKNNDRSFFFLSVRLYECVWWEGFIFIPYTLKGFIKVGKVEAHVAFFFIFILPLSLSHPSILHSSFSFKCSYVSWNRCSFFFAISKT